MILNTENILLIGSILLFLSLLASKTSNRFGVPFLVLFILLGLLAGSEGFGGIYFDNPEVAQFIGTVALNFILFSGGLETKWESTKPVIGRGIMLSTLGVLVSTFSIGAFVHYLIKASWLEGFLLGAIISSTDAAAVFSVLRSKNVGLKGSIRPTLEIESGSNDPMAYMLTVSLISLIQNPDQHWYTIIPLVIMELVIGAFVGFVMGRIGARLMKRIKLSLDSLYPILLLAIIFFTYSFSGLVHGNGFLSVYICGIILGRNEFSNRASMIRFFDVNAWLMQIVLFLVLGLQAYPSKLLSIAGIGVVISLFLMFVARPLSVFISLSFFKMRTRSKLFISWVGLRGAVPIVFATYPLLAGLDKAETIFHVVFFISITSVLIQGTTLPYAAKLFKVAAPSRIKRRTLLDRELSEIQTKVIGEIGILKNNKSVGKVLGDLDLPIDTAIILIKRQAHHFTPNEETIIEANDELIIAAESEAAALKAFEKFS